MADDSNTIIDEEPLDDLQDEKSGEDEENTEELKDQESAVEDISDQEPAVDDGSNEGNIKTLAYTAKTWKTNDVIEADNLNAIEKELSSVSSSIDELNTNLIGTFTFTVSGNSSKSLIYGSGQTTGTASVLFVCCRSTVSNLYGNYLISSYGYSSTRTVVIDLGSGSSIKCEVSDSDWGVIFTNSSSSSASCKALVLMGNTPSV